MDRFDRVASEDRLPEPSTTLTALAESHRLGIVHPVLGVPLNVVL